MGVGIDTNEKELCLNNVKRDGRGHGRNIFGANRRLHIFKGGMKSIKGGMKSSSERFMSCVGDTIGCSGLYCINSMHVIGKSVDYYVKPRFDDMNNGWWRWRRCGNFFVGGDESADG
jgi:hypothetical protein